MSPRRNPAAEIFENPILVGTITVLVTLVAVYLSYIAENGLPFVPSYSVSVDVENASELTKNADVRIGGARVGQVLAITAEPADPHDRLWPHPYARLRLSLDKRLQPLPPDTHYQVRLASVLGGKYVELLPGTVTDRSRGIPDGGTITLDRHLNRPFVDLDTAFNTFGPRTQAGVRHTVAVLGDALAGRGADLNSSIGQLRALLPPAERVLRRLAAPDTELGRFLTGAAAASSRLAGVAPGVTALLTDAATTFAALDTSALGQTIDALPAVETTATSVFTRAEPVLADAAAIAVELRPGARILPAAAFGLAATITAATPVFRRVPDFSAELAATAAAVGTLARDPAATHSFTRLGTSDLATFGSSAFVGLGAILRAVAPAQFACNVTGPWLRNFASTLSEGDAAGTWVRGSPMIAPNQTFMTGTPAVDLHANPYPVADATRCQAGNEPYRPGRQIGDPGATSTAHDATPTPPEILARGRAKGLVP